MLCKSVRMFSVAESVCISIYFYLREEIRFFNSWTFEPAYFGVAWALCECVCEYEAKIVYNECIEPIPCSCTPVLVYSNLPIHKHTNITTTCIRCVRNQFLPFMVINCGDVAAVLFRMSLSLCWSAFECTLIYALIVCRFGAYHLK